MTLLCKGGGSPLRSGLDTAPLDIIGREDGAHDVTTEHVPPVGFVVRPWTRMARSERVETFGTSPWSGYCGWEAARRCWPMTWFAYAEPVTHRDPSRGDR